ncbi:amidohydrolase family protein [Salinimicrobium xinjiangense]|uniref:amidohydrolase family protein n=1 Tax=Salinimicrobium xinjiangense TaxID=438596 RepID=UPI0004259C95|nr:amidohydrolase family protein [Salinimicrobium xinjiangense]
MKTSDHPKKGIYSFIFFFSFLLIQPVVSQDTGDEEIRTGASEKYTGPIIDMHLHSYSDDFWGPAPSPATGNLSGTTAKEQMEQTFEVMRKHNIVLGAVSGIDPSSGNDWHSFDQSRTLRGIELREPSEFMSADSLRMMIQQGNLDMLGEVGAQYFGYSPSDPGYYPFYKVAEEEGIPVGIHTGASFPGTPFRCCPKFRLKMGNPLLLEDMLVEFPKLRVFMMHAGGAGPYSEYALMMMNMYPQLYTDISIVNWIPGMEPVLESFLRQAKQMGMLDRILFGTDQMIWPEAIGIAVDNINSLDFLTLEEKADIFYNNAAEFLGLEEDVINQHHEMLAGGKGK